MPGEIQDRFSPGRAAGGEDADANMAVGEEMERLERESLRPFPSRGVCPTPSRRYNR
ncbi:MAG: hypothetical protein WHT06_05695 [Desulfobacterales bacterium]